MYVRVRQLPVSLSVNSFFLALSQCFRAVGLCGSCQRDCRLKGTGRPGASEHEQAQSLCCSKNIARRHPLGRHDVCPVSPLTQEWGGPLHERGVEGMRPTQWRWHLDDMLVMDQSALAR